MARFCLALAATVLLGPPLPAAAESRLEVADLMRHVAAGQRHSEDVLSRAAYEERETRVTYDLSGNPKKSDTRVYLFRSGRAAGERELVEVNGRAATDEEKQAAVREDEKRRRRRRPESNDEMAIPRISEILTRYEHRLSGTRVLDGRLIYVVQFSPRPTDPVGLSDRALSALAGQILVDARTLQVVSISAWNVTPVSVAGGLAARITNAAVRYEGQSVGGDLWLPRFVAVRVKGRKGVVFPLDTEMRFEWRFREGARSAFGS